MPGVNIQINNLVRKQYMIFILLNLKILNLMILNLNSKLENPIMLVSQLLIQHLGDNAVDDFHSTNLKMLNPIMLVSHFLIQHLGVKAEYDFHIIRRVLKTPN